MRRLIILVFSSLVSFASIGQDSDTTVTLDVLQAPASPAFNILGVSPSSIERPTDLNAFRVSLQNASNSFSKFPTDYAVEFAPNLLFNRYSYTLNQMNSKKFEDVFSQSLSLSFGITQGNLEDKQTADTSNFTKLGIGLKFSIIRPSWSSKTKVLYDKLIAEQIAHQNRILAVMVNHQSLKSLRQDYNEVELSDVSEPEKERKRNLIEERRKVVRDSLHKANHNVLYDSSALKEINTAARAFKMDRNGMFLDFAGGLALDFPDNNFDYSLTSKVGAWLTGGYEGGNNGLTVLGIVRYLYQPDKVFADDNNALNINNISTLDGGARLIVNAMDGKFNVSAEGIYRSTLRAGTVDPTWRFTLNADYDIGFNKKITFAIGKNFDGTITKGGNLIAALNFIAGFGTTKKIAPQQSE